ncbi:hypothetical protein OESDEN_12521, partial [Oesophagostomum dentatum]
LKNANGQLINKKCQEKHQSNGDTINLPRPLPPDLLPPGEALTLRPYPKTVVAIQVQDLKNGATHYWSIEKLKQRLESMRDMYGADQLSPCDDPMMEALMGTDPFYDRFPWFRMIGRAFVYLSNLLHNVPLVHKVAIVSEKGEVRGYLKVAIEPVNPLEADTQKKGVRQTAKLHFRKEDFLKTCRNGENEDESQKLTFPPHMKEDEEFCFRVVVLQAIDVSEQYSDVFCQFKHSVTLRRSQKDSSLSDDIALLAPLKFAQRRIC